MRDGWRSAPMRIGRRKWYRQPRRKERKRPADAVRGIRREEEMESAGYLKMCIRGIGWKTRAVFRRS